MNQNISTPTLPAVPNVNSILISRYGGLASAVLALYGWATKLNLFLSRHLAILGNNASTDIRGADIVSATTIHITNSFHHVTGNATITTIVPPPEFAGGPVWLAQEGTWTLATGGNIEAAAAPISGQALQLIWIPKGGAGSAHPTSHWHPVM
ncbi:MAG: hypothetical protein KGJ90_01935 [Patescibacteria group bacterium]|nr:hypothetical protein [Patescibacteria group bacterium]